MSHPYESGSAGKRRRAICLLAGAAALVAVLSGCAPQQPAEEPPPAAGQAIELTDLAGRSVELPEPAERVVAIGPGALRLVVYAGGVDRVVGIEEIESQPPIARPYLIAHPELLELPVIGVGGPDSAPDAERILGVEPDVIIVGQIADASAAEELQAATDIPVVVVSYGALGSIDEALLQSITLVGEVLGTQARATEVTDYLDEVQLDLETRAAGLPEADRPSVYVGAVAFKGAHGIESTQGDYPPLEAIGARNVAAGVRPAQGGSVMIDREQLIEWNPERVFLDRSGLSLVRDDISTNRVYYEELSAFQDGEVYAQIPFNNYWTNVELALANAYYAGTVLFPDQFEDVTDPGAKADEIAEMLVGEPVYEQLVEIYGGGFGRLDLLEE